MPQLMCGQCHIPLEEDYKPHHYFCPCCGMHTVDYGDEDPEEYAEEYDPETWE